MRRLGLHKAYQRAAKQAGDVEAVLRDRRAWTCCDLDPDDPVFRQRGPY